MLAIPLQIQSCGTGHAAPEVYAFLRQVFLLHQAMSDHRVSNNERIRALYNYPGESSQSCKGTSGESDISFSGVGGRRSSTAILLRLAGCNPSLGCMKMGLFFRHIRVGYGSPRPTLVWRNAKILVTFIGSDDFVQSLLIIFVL